MARKDTAPKRVAIKVLLLPEEAERAKFWAESKGYASTNQFVAAAIEHMIAQFNGNYDLPALEIQRLNQLIDEMRSVSMNVANLETVVTSGFDSLLGLTRGDSYLQDAEDGEYSEDSDADEWDSANYAFGIGGL